VDTPDLEPLLQGAINRRSALAYLQHKLAQACAELPDSFPELKTWEEYKAELLTWLHRNLPVWDLPENPSSAITATSALSSDLILEAADVTLDEPFVLPVHVYRPAKVSKSLPAVIVCPGYAQRKNDSDMGMVKICQALARSGFITAAVEYDGTGERADRPDIHTNINNVSAVGHLLGVNNLGLRVMANLAVLHYLQSREDVENSRIGITGLCQGALTTWFTAAVCEEFAAVAPLCGATTFEAIALEYCNRQGGWSGISPYVYNMLSIGDLQHVAACVAPRPLLVQNNLLDIHWPLSGFEKVKQICNRVYHLYDAGYACRFRLEDGPHAFAEPFISNIIEFFHSSLGH
jgi:hypothetical protein